MTKLHGGRILILLEKYCFTPSKQCWFPSFKVSNNKLKPNKTEDLILVELIRSHCFRRYLNRPFLTGKKLFIMYFFRKISCIEFLKEWNKTKNGCRLTFFNSMLNSSKTTNCISFMQIQVANFYR